MLLPTLPNPATRHDVLGLTFDELVAHLRPQAREVRPLRNAYKLLLGRPPARPGRSPGCEMPLPDGRGSDVPCPDYSGSDRHLTGGDGPDRPGFPLCADVLPIVRRIDDGGLTKFVQRTHDGLEIESVLVPMQGHWRSWKSLCVSSQIGCARGCEFCETAQLGLLRNLTASEIVGQVVAAQRGLGQKVRNVVFMGMGEPLDNYDAVIQALRVLADGGGLSFSRERLTISTVGRIAGIRKLAKLGWRRLNLAVSLNAPNDEIRSRIMPNNRREPMAALRAALLAYPLRNCQFLMIEYVLIPGVNDAPAHARELAEYLRPLKCVVNVIPYNPRRESPWPAPAEETIRRFMAELDAAGRPCLRRITKGRDQMAACGQLGNRAIARPLSS